MPVRGGLAKAAAMTDQPAAAVPEDIAALSFEDALKQLEGIVAKLESGQAPLEESIALYERGALLKGHCEARLKAAQLRVEKIVVGPNGPERLEAAEFT